MPAFTCRLTRALLPALAVAALVAGCGDDSPDSVAKETAHPLKVQHALGETKVPGRAERPVALYTGELDDSIALGVTPVGAAVADGTSAFPGYLGARTAGVERVGTVSHPDVGRVEALDPDLILGTIPSHEDLYDRLKRIAPTVIADEGVSWKPNLRQDGEALGRVDDAEAMLSAYDRRVVRLKRRLGAYGSAESVERALPAGVRGSLARPFIASILDDLGLPHARAERSERLRGSPGPFDAWSLGIGVIAANRVLDDAERYLARR